MSYLIETMSQDDLAVAAQWAAEEGWNPGIYDVDSFYAADPHGFLVGRLHGEPIASISVVKYGDSFGFLGFYIVKPDYRGKGYGLKIWQAGIDYLKGRNIGLDGVVDQQENYKKSGFKLAYNNMRFEGRTGGARSSPKDISAIDEYDFSLLARYDADFFPANRKTFLKGWLNQPESVGLVHSSTRKVSGYGMIRKCQCGYKIGPLFANSATIAEQLFLELLASVDSDQPVYLDICDQNPDALALVKKHGMERVFETARMYTHEQPDLPLARLYGVTSFELG